MWYQAQAHQYLCVMLHMKQSSTRALWHNKPAYKNEMKRWNKNLQTLNPRSGRADLSQWAGIPLNSSVRLQPLYIKRHYKQAIKTQQILTFYMHMILNIFAKFGENTGNLTYSETFQNCLFSSADENIFPNHYVKTYGRKEDAKWTRNLDIRWTKDETSSLSCEELNLHIKALINWGKYLKMHLLSYPYVRNRTDTALPCYFHPHFS